MAHFPANSGGEIAQEIATGITGLTAARYGKVVILTFQNVTVTNRSVGNLPNTFPRAKVEARNFGRWTTSDEKYQLALIAMNADTRAVTSIGYLAGTSSSEFSGTVTGELVYITDD